MRFDYFQEKLPKDGAYPYTAMLTIKDMLIMRTCHNETTFKAKGVTDCLFLGAANGSSFGEAI